MARKLSTTGAIRAASANARLNIAVAKDKFPSMAVLCEEDELVEKIRGALGPDFDVLLESNHLHVEFQKKVPL